MPDPLASREPTRRQVPGYTEFKRAEGIWFDAPAVYVATTGDSRIHAYDTRTERIKVIYDGLAKKSAPLLRVDNITASKSGELFVCEDIGTEEMDIGVITRDRKVSKCISVTGPKHAGSELTGVAFDPSGRRLYFASQRAEEDRGAVYEISGPFRSESRRSRRLRRLEGALVLRRRTGCSPN